MVVDAVAEEDPLGVDEEVGIFRGAAVDRVALEDGFEGMAHREIPCAILVPGDVTTPFCRFGQMVGISFLPEGQAVPAGNLVADDLKVGELVDGVAEGFGFFRGTGAKCGGSGNDKTHSDDIVHVL